MGGRPGRPRAGARTATLQEQILARLISARETCPNRPRRLGDAPHRQADDVVIIGAGPAGLTAAFELGRLGKTCTVLEADDEVGGISRTTERDGWRFDIGGHRFFTKVKVVERLLARDPAR